MNDNSRQGVLKHSRLRRLKAFILWLFQVAPLLLIAAHVRPVVVLRAVKLIARLPGGFLIAGLFDPNVIRKRIDISFRQKLVPLNCYGGTFLVDVNEHLGYRFFINDGFDPLVLHVSNCLEIDETSILLDIGANIGSTCIPFAMKYNATVIAVEASKNNAFLLLKNAWLNGIRLWPHIVCAVDPLTAGSKEWLQFFSKNGNSAANSIFEEWNPSRSASSSEYVKTTTIDSILENVDLEKIRLVKIDVEGAEAMVLKGFRKLCLLRAPLLFEYRVDVMKRDLNDDGSEMLNVIGDHFDVFGIDELGGSFALCNFDPEKPCANAIAIPKSSREYFLARFQRAQLRT
jgi:FkbM family methyltransferase